MIIVSDTSALGNLAIVDQLNLLQDIYSTVVIPDMVAQEISNATSPRIRAILNLEWVQIQHIKNQPMVDALQQNSNLDSGESHAIVLAIEQQADELLIDERRGRREATKLGISIIGILGVLILAKRRGLILQVQPILDALIEEAGFRVSPQLYTQVLSQADER